MQTPLGPLKLPPVNFRSAERPYPLDQHIDDSCDGPTSAHKVLESQNATHAYQLRNAFECSEDMHLHNSASTLSREALSSLSTSDLKSWMATSRPRSIDSWYKSAGSGLTAGTCMNKTLFRCSAR